ncbi:hypothetical protein BDZ97DRAFT_1442121 [Flammula alnicola]|nr:hypothetical protein BDZ97DRAFT_1442121 [Flammula alnicola]
MDVDDEEADELTELKSTTRGKKRDRAEAGSTFGGDDDESADELEADDSKARRRRRKRRTVAKRKSEASYARGKKRERDGEGDLSDEGSEESSLETKSSRKKRGKRSSHVDRRDHDQASKSDISMDESTTSTKSKVRNIGDEWESNGIKYKIGPNAQRLRQALVKKARQKFVMPKDSQHPDRDANLQVCIECWLTEEEYQDAKNQHLLAWQDSPERQEPTGKLSLDTSEAVPFPQGVPGKSLLWSTSTTSTPTRSPASHSPPAEAAPEIVKHRSYRDTYRHSIATTVGLPISPFVSSQIPTVKRIASTSRALSLSSSISGSTGLSDSTNGSPRTPHKVFSKWEKQELEAKAMMKMREATRKKELEREAKLKEERERTERAAAEKLRLERERLEREQRERAERERVAREKAEAEKKAKEAAQSAAQSAAVPQITVTAPSIGSIGQPSQSSACRLQFARFLQRPIWWIDFLCFAFRSSQGRKDPEHSTFIDSFLLQRHCSTSSGFRASLEWAQAQAKPPTFSFAPAGTSGGAAPSAVKPGMFSSPMRRRWVAESRRRLKQLRPRVLVVPC